MAEGARRPAWAEVDLEAIRHNCAVLRSIVAPARLCAVVKADAYGHGAVPVAHAALAGGARELAVAIVDEGVELRDAGIDAPILVLSEPASDAMEEVFAYRLTPTLYTAEGVALAAEAAQSALGVSPARRAPVSRPQASDVPHLAGGTGTGTGTGGPAVRSSRPTVPVEIKVDTGMHRVGADPAMLPRLVALLAERPQLDFVGLWTHLAVADEPGNPFTGEQLDRFDACRQALVTAGLPQPRRFHAANSAGALCWPRARLDLVRCGISVYGYAPSPTVAGIVASAVAGAGWAQSDGLRPALSWSARVSFVREVEAGERVSYGLKQPLAERSLVATLPLGYADGIPRAFFTGGGHVLVNGRRRALAGSVTMDQILLDCGDDSSVGPGDEVVLIGAQGGEHVTADDWARALDTISYEVLTRIGPRVPRIYRPMALRVDASLVGGAVSDTVATT